MANTAQGDAIALIEEQVDSGLRDLLSAYQPSYMLGGPNRDELNKRYSIRLGAPLPQFNTASAKAYEAADPNNTGREIYALVLDSHYDYRMHAIENLAGWQHPNLVTILDHGTVFLTSLNEAHEVIIIDKPAGRRLSDIIAQQRIAQEHIIKDSILNPISKALLALRDKNIVHGGINPRSIYVGDLLQIGECVGEPTGLSQDYMYEPPERMLCDSIAKGFGNEKNDVYATAVMTYELIYGLEHLRRFTKEEFTRMVLEQGLYSVFANNRDFPDSLQDFFRGIFCDNPAERWGVDQLTQWVNGKRFNMISSSGTRDAVRSLTFDEVDYYSQRALANALHRNWRDALKEVRQLKLDRWAEMSLHRPEVAERIARAMRSAGNEYQASERQNNDMLTRIICILDPVGPMRTQYLSVRPDGMGHALVNALHKGLNSEMKELLELIENDIGNYCADLAEHTKTPDLSQFLWKLQRVKIHLKNRALGFGIERVLYDLNPSLPCQSSMVAPYHITNLTDLLRTLDTLAKKMAPDTALIDRHIAAYIASKIDMGKEIRLHDLSAIPQLAHNQELIMMRIIAKAQQKQDKIPLHGLCIWAAMRVEKMLDCIHNRAFRRKMKLQLKNVISNGHLNDLLDVIVNRDIATRDHEGFAQAITLHQINGQRIDRLKNPQVLEKMSKDLGGRIAVIMAYTILAVTIYIVANDFMVS